MCQRPYSIRTRIKTHRKGTVYRRHDQVRDHIPLEQGLRLGMVVILILPTIRQRPYSIRTRIKTAPRRCTRRSQARQRPYSIRTRIKTAARRRKQRRPLRVRDHIPLEQGLRQDHKLPSYNLLMSQRPYSIRTRIKTSSVTSAESNTNVRDHIPLEQGLRPARGYFHCVWHLFSETIFH